MPATCEDIDVRVLPNLQNDIDIEAVVTAELASWNKLLPPRWGDRSLAGSEIEVGHWLKSLMRREITVDSEEVLLARKLGRGARPVTLLGLKERLLYRGAVSLVEAEVGTPDRSQEAYEAFRNAPLSSPDCAYVLKADIASYYQYVDHERLVDEVVAQTGDDLAVTLAVDLLRETSSKRFGLPQLSSVSDVLADVYIDPVRRDLVRAGYEVWRFADDFRVACHNYGEALRALEVTDQAARDLGLVLNELKTSTPKRERYEHSLGAEHEREHQLFASLDVEELEDLISTEYSDEDDMTEPASPGSLLEETDFDEGDVSVSPEVEDAEVVSATQLAAARKVVGIWAEEEEDEETQRAEHAEITAKLLGRALRVFGLGGDPFALEHAPAMLVYEPSLTPTIARYLRSLGRHARRPTREALDDICQSGIVSAWQAAWIAYAAGELPRKRGGAQLAHVVWLRQQLRSDRPILRSEAALALARRRLIRPDELLEVMQGLPSMHRPTLLLALAALGAESEAIGAAESELDRSRIRWALEKL